MVALLSSITWTLSVIDVLLILLWPSPTLLRTNTMTCSRNRFLIRPLRHHHDNFLSPLRHPLFLSSSILIIELFLRDADRSPADRSVTLFLDDGPPFVLHGLSSFFSLRFTHGGVEQFSE